MWISGGGSTGTGSRRGPRKPPRLPGAGRGACRPSGKRRARRPPGGCRRRLQTEASGKGRREGRRARPGGPGPGSAAGDPGGGAGKDARDALRSRSGRGKAATLPPLRGASAVSRADHGYQRQCRMARVRRPPSRAARDGLPVRDGLAAMDGNGVRGGGPVAIGRAGRSPGGAPGLTLGTPCVRGPAGVKSFRACLPAGLRQF
jgi:hypothetical protein